MPHLAARLFNKASLAWTQETSFHYEAAFAYRLTGDHTRAARLLAKAFTIQPNNERIRQFLAHMMFATGAHSQGLGVLDMQNASGGPVQDARQLFSDFSQYMQNFPKSASLILRDEVCSKYEELSTQAVYSEISRAIYDRSPFSLIRLGDGEGSCLSLGDVDEMEYAALYAANRRELTEMWFGKDFPSEQNGFQALSRSLPDVLAQTDIIGIPYESWIEHEYNISSTRGIPSLVNILRCIRNASLNTKICSQLIHMDLQNGDFIGKLIKQADKIALISCLSELPDLIKTRFEISSVDFYKIPGEKGSSSVLGEAASAGTHYPNAYHEIMERLSTPHDGKLFLVAGGILGKFYVNKIKEFGGVALDIGSLADGWAKKNTRPGMSNQFAL
ncbi:hypothetical protein GA0004734_00032400 [Rhizobium sp. 9140]|nr:hypothetical protein GA0004734_00032400 [Rhizobium sp. 9140]